MILPYYINTNRVARDVRTATDLIASVVVGRKSLQLICSPSGFAKTSITMQQCKAHGITKWAAGVKLRGNGFFLDSRPTKAIAAVRSIHECMQIQAAMLLLDDPGPIAKSEAILDVLKTSFGAQRECTLGTPESTKNDRYRLAGSLRYDPLILPAQFPTGNLRMLWLSNTNFTDPALLAKLGDHFAPLIARGLNPFWIDDDREHDNYDLFLWVHYLATEKNLLRSMGFPYGISRQAVNFYVTYCHRLYDLAPRRLELIANAFRFDNAAARDAELASMLAKNDLRPRLKLPESWVTVPGGVLLWPDTPFKPSPSESPSQMPVAAQPAAPDPKPLSDPTPPADSRPGQKAIYRDAEVAREATNPQPTSVTKESPLTGRQAILQTIATMLRGRFHRVRITGTPAKLEINGFDDRYQLQVIVIAALPPHPDIQDDDFNLEFVEGKDRQQVIDLLGPSGVLLPRGRVLLRELAPRDGDKLNLNEKNIEWHLTVGPEVRDKLVAACRARETNKKALAGKHGAARIKIHAADGELSLADDGPIEFEVPGLMWLLRKQWTALSLSNQGLIRAIVRCELGDITFYCRGFDTGHRKEPTTGFVLVGKVVPVTRRPRKPVLQLAAPSKNLPDETPPKVVADEARSANNSNCSPMQFSASPRAQ